MSEDGECAECGREATGHEDWCSCDAAERRNAKLAKRRAARKERDAVCRSLGLTKVRGSLGGTYWE